MSAIPLGDAEVGVAIGIHVFAEFITELFNSGAIPADLTFPFDLDGDGEDEFWVTLVLEPPTFSLETGEDGEPFTQLWLTGQLQIRGIGAPDGDPLLENELDVRARLMLRLVDRDGETPVLRLVFDGVEGTPSAPIQVEHVTALFAEPMVAEVLDAVEIDIVGPLVDGLTPVFFAEDDVPSRDQWPPVLTLLPAASEGTVDCVLVTVARPETSATPGPMTSPLPLRTGFGLIYSRSFLDFVLDAAAREEEGGTVSGATITELDLSMDETAVLVRGEVTRAGVSISFEGPLHPHLIRGTTMLFIDSESVEVDDRGALADFLRFLGLFFGVSFFPAVFAVPRIWNAAGAIDDAPETIQGGLAAAMGPALTQLADGLTLETDVGGVGLDSTPDRLEIRGGSFLFLAQVFVSPVEDDILHGLFSPELRRFELYRLFGGRKFKASELGRLASDGRIRLHTHHGVARNSSYHVRSNPDPTIDNNLQRRFGHLRPDEPIVTDLPDEPEF